MDMTARNGIAAHWLYKTKGYVSPTEVKTREWLKQLLDSSNSLDLIENVKIDLFPDEVYVFTPKGDILQLPKGATIIDFAYLVHTEVGDKCVAAKVNRRLVPLSYKLLNGQTVEIISSPKASPNPSWLNFVITGKAKSAIKNFLKTREEEESIALGKKLLSNSLAELKVELQSIDKDILKKLYDEINLSEKSLYKQIGAGERSSQVVAHQLLELSSKNKPQTIDKSSLKIQGLEGLNLKFAKCCYPIPGDPVKGILIKGHGVEIHNNQCEVWNSNSVKRNSDSIILLDWSSNMTDLFPVKLRIDTQNIKGAIAQIAKALYDSNANIREFHVKESDPSYGVISTIIEVKDRVHLAKVLKRIKHLSCVMRVFREKNH
jgi:guanosine-3',5'-bis(diphosphate) 3'-pyrophosphohydrolase